MPEPFLQMTYGIYDGRTFRVRDGNGISGSHAQKSSMSQGCTLSRFLFAALMTVLLQDVEHEISTKHGDRPSAKYIPSRDLLYAEDTLGAEVSTEALQDFLDAVVARKAKHTA